MNKEETLLVHVANHTLAILLCILTLKPNIKAKYYLPCLGTEVRWELYCGAN
jgi:hypothetical protein